VTARPIDPSTPSAPSSSWRQSKRLALAELGLVALLFVADKYHLVPLTKTPFLLLLAWVSLRVRRVRWKDIGLTRNNSWRMTLAVGVGAGLGLELFQLFVTQPLLVSLIGKPPDLSDFRSVTGNVKLTLLLVVASWTLAAFGEELAWRGYVMNRVADLGRNAWFIWMVSLLVTSLAFGFSHTDQGLTGQIEESIAGGLLAALYLATDRNLAVPILAHGAADTLDFVLIFLGKYPGM
jgi:membrane protease YdiL (CAAX protease family)